jgi:hypothetical protein
MSKMEIAPAIKRKEVAWLQDWMCGHVYELTLSQVAAINRYLVYNEVNDHNYVKIWVEYYLDRMREASRDDVVNIKDTCNKVKLRDWKIGRDLFYALGRRYQDLSMKPDVNSKAIVRLG